jgi:hypothetical protein
MGRRLPWAGLAGLAAIVAGLVLVVVAVVGVTGTKKRSTVRQTPRPIAAATALDPRTIAFGGSLAATIRVVFDRSGVEPASVRLVNTFKPFRIISAATTRHDAGRLTEIRYALRLQCLTSRCLPPLNRKREFSFAPSTVRYVSAGLPHTLEVSWPRVGVSSHLTATELAASRQVNPLFFADLGTAGITFTQVVANLRESPGTLRPVDYRIAPGLLSVALFSLAGLLALLAGGIVFHRLLWVRPTADAALRTAPGSPVEQALGVLDLALANGHVDAQRKALERLARALGNNGASGDAWRARRLAWRRPTVPREEARQLADDVRESIESEPDGVT